LQCRRAIFGFAKNLFLALLAQLYFAYWAQQPEAAIRDIHIECSKQFKWNSYFYVSGQRWPFWAMLKLLQNSNMKFK
jgi:hypothetical protein